MRQKPKFCIVQLVMDRIPEILGFGPRVLEVEKIGSRKVQECFSSFFDVFLPYLTNFQRGERPKTDPGKPKIRFRVPDPSLISSMH